jgi:plasmid stability protein
MATLNVSVSDEVKRAVKARAAVCGATLQSTVERLLVKALLSENAMPQKAKGA